MGNSPVNSAYLDRGPQQGLWGFSRHCVFPRNSGAIDRAVPDVVIQLPADSDARPHAKLVISAAKAYAWEALYSLCVMAVPASA